MSADSNPTVAADADIDTETVRRVDSWLQRSDLEPTDVTVAQTAGVVGLRPDDAEAALGALRERRDDNDVPEAIQVRPPAAVRQGLPRKWPNDTPRYTYVGHVRRDDVPDSWSLYVGREGPDGHLESIDPPNYGWLGNPFQLSDYSRLESVQRFEEVFTERLRDDPEFRQYVYAHCRGRVLLCYCHDLHKCGDPSRRACHADVIARVVDQQLHTDAERGGGET